MALRAAALILLALAAAAPARAWSPAETARLDTGEPVVSLSRAPDGEAIQIRAAIDIAVPPTTIWSIMTNCAGAARFVPGLESCRVLERDTQGRWDIREHEISWTWFMPRVRSVFRTDYEPPKRLQFRRIAGTLKRNEGEWRLTPLASGVTRVSYDATLAADIPVPDFMIEEALRSDIAKVLRRLKQECEATARN
jgi:uncharacterized protein YndB with AHSA1/START domain